MKISDSKIIISSNSIHVYRYSETYRYDYPRPPQKRKKSGAELTSGNSLYSLYRSRKAVRLIIENNAVRESFKIGSPIRPLFVTLTFAENITDIKKANKEFGNFRTRLDRAIKKEKPNIETPLKYLVVPEFQKRGAVHYHIIYFTFPVLEDTNKFLHKIWGQGFTFNNTIKSVEHLKNYVTKYFIKSAGDTRLGRQKHYFCSKKLSRPTILKDKNNNDAIISLLGKPTFETQYLKDGKPISYATYENHPLISMLYINEKSKINDKPPLELKEPKQLELFPKKENKI